MEDGSSRFHLVLWILFICLSLKQGAQGEECSCYNTSLNEKEFLLCPCKKTREEAVEYCRATLPDGRLASVQDADVQRLLASALKAAMFGDTWVGASNVRSQWHWASSKTKFMSQGCYDLTTDTHDMNNEVAVSEMKPDNCVESCKLFGYKYAGLLQGSRCFCGNNIGSPLMTDGCDTPCTGDETIICGGQDYFSIYNVNGTYSDLLAPGYVGPLQSPDTRECVQLHCDYATDGEIWSWRTVPCKKKNTHLCMTNKDPADCTSSVEVLINNTCVIVEEIKFTNWFEARWQCDKRGGILLEIPDRNFQRALESSLQCWQSPLWIGATRISWSWPREDEVLYTAWATQNPSGNSRTCVAMSITLSSEYEWTDLDCNQYLSFICEQGEETTTQPPTTTTTTTTTPTTTTTTTIAPTTPKPITLTTKTTKTIATTPTPNPGASVPAGPSGSNLPSGTTSTTENPRVDKTERGGQTPTPAGVSTTKGDIGLDGTKEPQGGADNKKWIYVAVGIIVGLIVIIAIFVYIVESTKFGRNHCAHIRRCNCLRSSSKYEEDELPNGCIKMSNAENHLPNENGHAGKTNSSMNINGKDHTKTNGNVI